MSFYELTDWLTYLSPAVLLLGISVGMWHFRKSDRAYKVITCYLAVALLMDVSGRVVAAVYENNLFFVVLFSLVELGLFALLYFGALFGKRYSLLLLLVMGGAGFIVWELSHLSYYRIREFQSYARVVDAFLITVLALTYFSESFKREEGPKLQFFRLNAILLIFFSYNLVFFLPINFLINVATDHGFYVLFANLIITIAFYLFLTHELWKNGTTRKQLRSG